MFIERYYIGLVAMVSLKFLQLIFWLLRFEVPRLLRDTELCLPLRFHSLFWTHECVSQQPSGVGFCVQGRPGQGLTKYPSDR